MSFNPMPEEYELIGLFECEPILMDQGVPWSYNHLTFHSTRGKDVVTCIMEPGYHTLKFQWVRDEVEHLNLDFGWVEGIQVTMKPNKESLQLLFLYRETVEIQLKPNICFSFTSKHEPA